MEKKTIKETTPLLKKNCPLCGKKCFLIEDLPEIWRGFCGRCNRPVTEDRTAKSKRKNAAK